jgi:hypothetical protein
MKGITLLVVLISTFLGDSTWLRRKDGCERWQIWVQLNASISFCIFIKKSNEWDCVLKDLVQRSSMIYPLMAIFMANLSRNLHVVFQKVCSKIERPRISMCKFKNALHGLKYWLHIWYESYQNAISLECVNCLVLWFLWEGCSNGNLVVRKMIMKKIGH